MEARQIAPAFNPERMVQYFALVFKGFTSSCNSSGNKGSQATVRNSFQKGTLDIFLDTVEVDETYIGGQWKNKRHSAKAGGSKRGRGTSKTPVFGILCRGGKVWAQVVDDVEAKALLPLISRWVELGSTVCSDTWKSYTGVAAKGYVHLW